MKIRTLEIWQWTLGAILVAAIAAGCAGMKPASAPPPAVSSPAMEDLPASSVTMEGQPAPEPEPEPDDYIHVVSLEGETLSLIAKWYTGDLGNWTALAEVNPDIDPNRIFIGDEILIPEEMLVTRDPIPQSFLDEAYSK